MAGRTVPKIKVSKKKFEAILENNNITYDELGTMRGVDRTGSAIWKNVNSGEMPIYTAMAIAYCLDVDLKTFSTSSMSSNKIIGFVKLLTKTQRKELYLMLRKEFKE